MFQPLRATLILFALLLPMHALACSCVPWDTDRMLENADAVFLGEVSTIVEPPGSPYRGVTLHVLRDFADSGEPKLRVWTRRHGTACGVSFVPGEDYLVFAYRDDKGALYTSTCSTLPRERAADALRDLETRRD